MGLFKHKEVWLGRGAILTLLFGSLLLFKFLFDSQPSPIPVAVDLSSPAVETVAVPQLPNSYLPCEDYVKPGSSIQELDIAKYFKSNLEDSELLHAAQDAATLPLPPGVPKIAFLFILRQKIPLEPLWDRFFKGVDEERYSIYTHPSWWADEFPETSLFHNRSVATKPVSRFDISLADVVRRLLAFALLDRGRANMCSCSFRKLVFL